MQCAKKNQHKPTVKARTQCVSHLLLPASPYSKSLFIYMFVPHIVSHNVSNKVEKMLKYQMLEPAMC